MYIRKMVKIMRWAKGKLGQRLVVVVLCCSVLTGQGSMRYSPADTCSMLDAPFLKVPSLDYTCGLSLSTT